jgi:hypothetical protein
MITQLLNFFKKPKTKTKTSPPSGYCPNCWGSQEYDNQVRELYKNHQIDVNNHQANYAFIQDFVVKHLDGVRLKKKRNRFECPSCSVQLSVG